MNRSSDFQQRIQVAAYRALRAGKAGCSALNRGFDFGDADFFGMVISMPVGGLLKCGSLAHRPIR